MLNAFWIPIIERMQHKLHNWKYAYMSKGSCHTLIQATLSNFPTYYLSFIMLHPTLSK